MSLLIWARVFKVELCFVFTSCFFVWGDGAELGFDWVELDVLIEIVNLLLLSLHFRVLLWLLEQINFKIGSFVAFLALCWIIVRFLEKVTARQVQNRFLDATTLLLHNRVRWAVHFQLNRALLVVWGDFERCFRSKSCLFDWVGFLSGGRLVQVNKAFLV